ncbi:MAG TPA: type II toxin-antitoxin system VapC family toxin [Blastocatellia bacterium]|nr:type II toxin-antitoxin system VapC family toxin [Blastocatellia bacterium]HMV82165.1 type II toxin-antitoxin system VapC family toxin [Blastocatellia bacterium]HMX26175.1 type II toxin-antitoxin system VapC family toxin [Blastocatellia bacterium]HMY74265.1 type II toxin-antitoxin system VapC family toxin [Blastocatellia bacterium]HMZ22312.1 type II toxin-antitoxin system VapC family toxin [Blastocatellia bacterium]
MTSSTKIKLERGLDTMFIVYSLLQNHPASAACERFIRDKKGWFTTTSSLLEAKAVLTKIYGIEAAQATANLVAFAEELFEVFPVDAHLTVAAMRLADSQKLDFTDSLLLVSAQNLGVTILATDDRKLVRVCGQMGITVESPIDSFLRQQMETWELTELAPKGLPRILLHLHGWLEQAHPEAAPDFWSQTGGGAHLP